MHSRIGDNKIRILVSVSGNCLLNFAMTSLEKNSSTEGNMETLLPNVDLNEISCLTTPVVAATYKITSRIGNLG